MNPEPLVNNALLRAAVRLLPFEQARALLRRTVVTAALPPRARARLRRRVEGHFARCFPHFAPAVRAQRARAFVQHWTSKLAEDCIALNYPSVERYRADVERLVVYEGWEQIFTALSHGRGLLLAGAHLGSVAYCTNALLAPLYTLAPARYPKVRFCSEPDVERFPRVLDHLQRALSHYGGDVRFILTKREPRLVAAEMAETLSGGGVVTTNIDVLFGGRSRRVFELFGGRARLYLPALVGAARIALQTGAVVQPWVSYRTARGFRLVLEPPLLPEGRGEPALERLCAQLARRLEAWITAAPQQWFYWDRFHRRLAPEPPR